MGCCKVYLTLSALIACHVSAKHEYEHSKALTHLVETSSRVPPSEILLPYDDSLDGSGKARSINPSGFLTTMSASKKKEPSERKNPKKTIPALRFTSTSNQSIKYKESFPSSAGAYCREIKMKSMGKEGVPRKGVTTCYKCKDPKTASTYERCLYNNQPEKSASADPTVLHLLSMPSFRYRRSNSARDKSGHYGKPRNPYRFADEYFTDETHDLPAAYENEGERCDKVVKDSMVCMVCKNNKTNGKYEQCSYVKQPREKAYSYAESSFFGKPRQPKDHNKERGERPEETSYSQFSDFDESDESSNDNPTAVKDSREYAYPSDHYINKTATAYKEEITSRHKSPEEEASSADCKRIQKDSKSCMVCKDSKTGDTYEKCSYSYQPSDKVYKYSRSKSFGYPDKISESTRDRGKLTQAPRNVDSNDGTYLDKYELSPSNPQKSGRDLAASRVASDSEHAPLLSSEYTGDYSETDRSIDYAPNSKDDSESYDESEGVSPDGVESVENKNVNNCQKIRKNSMTCTICKDPKTGDDFERCAYSYEPNDKHFSYSKSSTFGNPRRVGDSSESIQDEDERSDGSETASKFYRYVPDRIYEAETKTNETSREEDTEGSKRVDNGYLHTAKKKAEIEQFLQNFQKEDRSKCKKIMRDKMTCYRCVDEEGFQKEECVFVTAPSEPNKDQLAFREIKEFQVEPATHTRVSLQPPIAAKTKSVAIPLEPNTSASEKSLRREKSDEEKAEEAKPYDYASETRSRYDKVLGFTLPAYMFATSEHEAAFDEVVASGHRQR